MKLTIFNGSPRGRGGNSNVLINHFLKGFNKHRKKSEIIYLSRSHSPDELKKQFLESNKVIVAMPLYANFAPSIVIEFFEILKPLCDNINNPELGFLIQCGYPESCHLIPLESYLVKISKRLGCKYMGTIKRANVELTRGQPGFLNVGLYNIFYKLGFLFGKYESFDKSILKKLEKPIKSNFYQFRLFDILATHLYWNLLLRKNKALKNVNEKPFSN